MELTQDRDRWWALVSTVADHLVQLLGLLAYVRKFMAMRYKFNLVTYDQRPLVVERRGGTERNLDEITAGSR